MKEVTVQTTSGQHVITPIDWLHKTVCPIFPCGFDLAATDENAQFLDYYTERDDALSQDWSEAYRSSKANGGDYLWLNSPFCRPEPACLPDCSKGKCKKRGYHNIISQPGVGAWMEKCASEGGKGVQTVSLTLASLTTKWYREIVQKEALSLLIPYRLIFEGHKFPYPKELMLNVFGTGMTGLGYFNRK